MYKIIIKTLFIIIVTVVTSCASKEADIVFKDVNLIPMTGEFVVENISVHVSTADGKILGIGKFSDLTLPEDIRVIDASGKYLTPGFSDMHAHIYEPEELDLLIANGVTTVRNMWGYPMHLKARKKIKDKKIIGPELFTTGPLIDGKDPVWADSLILDKKEDVKKVITSIKRDGYDFIKVYERLKPSVYNEIIRVAKEIGIPVVGHVPKSVGLKNVIESGQQSIEHFSGYKYYSRNNNLVDKEVALTIEGGIWSCPTIITMKNLKLLKKIKKEGATETKYVKPETVDSWSYKASDDTNYKKAMNFVYKIHERKGLIVSGTDFNIPYVIAGFSLHDELQLLYESGLTPYEVLITTTVNPSIMLGISDRAGTIEEGKDADLVLLNKNPLTDITNTKSIAGVMSKGRWMNRDFLDELLKNVEEKMKL